MLTISVWPRRLKEFLLTHPLYKSPSAHLSDGVQPHSAIRLTPRPMFALIAQPEQIRLRFAQSRFAENALD